ncbi:YihY/virulence factor BrkB family protein [Salinibacterium soli]|uniref:YihY/virulence factor BrkB family protein n=1 Tax=Antiquaquibacter soli TaxID=3064523 RepID=A0ABT9BN73_9MICO|nr:YihY/virulence factor BrkB family protein [Protaetiibacter sp. WY-16]MDO7882419.1 YihY/virulence factor BrkB family protein [Protaetiibacter sp. WY-16]
MRDRIRALWDWGRSRFPVRVWVHFLDQNGLLLAAGMSYQSLFAVFAAAYVGFSIAGIWLTGQPQTLASLVEILSTAIPGLFGQRGVIDPDDLVAASSSILSVTGVVAAAGLIWTAIGWMTFARMSVRQVFGLPKDKRNYFLMKARDLLVSLVLGALLIVASGLSVASTEALHVVFAWFGLSTGSLWYTILARGSGLVLVLVLNTAVLAATFRFLSRAQIRWRRLWGGSLLGGLALLLLQLGASLLAGGATRNPLLATFAVFIGLLLFFRLTSIVTLVAAAWIAVGASDRGEPLVRLSPLELARRQELAEHEAVLTAARVRVRDARRDLAASPWWSRLAARSRLRSAQRELDALGQTPPSQTRSGPPERS